MFKKLVLSLMVFGLSFSATAEKAKVSPGAYYAGGAVGTIVGFGIGHAIQGRYGDMGWIFTLGEAGGLILMGSGIGWGIGALATGKTWSQTKWSELGTGPLIMGVVGMIAYSGFRIWDIVDVWIGATPVEGHANLFKIDENRFAGAKELGVAAFNVPLFAYKF